MHARDEAKAFGHRKKAPKKLLCCQFLFDLCTVGSFLFVNPFHHSRNVLHVNFLDYALRPLSAVFC